MGKKKKNSDAVRVAKLALAAAILTLITQLKIGRAHV